MTITASELKESRQYRANTGLATAERVFVVQDAADESEIIAIMDGTTDHLPAEFSLYPATFALPLDLHFTTFDIGKMSESPRMWRVVAHYRSKTSGTLVSVTTRPTSTGYRTLSGSLTAQFEDRWRSNESNTIAYPQHFTPAIPGADIGGLKIDFVGKPLSMLVFKQALTIQIVDGTIPNLGESGIGGQIGMRNDADFLGAPAGKVVFKGATFERVPDVHRFTISYEFELSGEGHLIQYPILDLAGRPILNTDGNAATVLFRQPFPKRTNFMALSQHFAGL